MSTLVVRSPARQRRCTGSRKPCTSSASAAPSSTKKSAPNASPSCIEAKRPRSPPKPLTPTWRHAGERGGLMTEKNPRRGRGEGSLYWDEEAPTASLPKRPSATHQQASESTRKGSGKTKTEARAKLKEVLRDHEDGVPAESRTATVADAIEDWLQYGLTGRSPRTIAKYGFICRGHITPDLGARKLRELTARDVDRWLSAKATNVEHEHPAAAPREPQSCDHPRHGPRPGPTKRRRAVRCAARAERPALEVAHV